MGDKPSMAERMSLLDWHINYPGMKVIFGYESQIGDSLHMPWLRVSAEGTCNDTGKDLSWVGRKWRLSEHMTDGEIVQTAFLAIMTALEHEARERFTYKGQRVFGPHLDIDKWADYLATHDMEKERAHGGTPHV